MSSSPPPPPRPATPQVLLHRLPDNPDTESYWSRAPSKYIVLLVGSTAVAGKLQIARSVTEALKCPLFQGESLHESAAKAASVGAGTGASTGRSSSSSNITGGNADIRKNRHHPNEARYQRMWLAKLTRTGLLFPEESRPATDASAVSEFRGWTSSATTSRRGSTSSVMSASDTSQSDMSSSSLFSTAAGDMAMASSGSGRGGFGRVPPPPPPPPANRPVTEVPVAIAMSEEERRRRENPALMVLTHPALEPWHKRVIRTAVGDYGIGVIFVPLYDEEDEDDEEADEKVEDENEEEELPILQPLDPRTMTSFPVSFGKAPPTAKRKRDGQGRLDRETKLRVNVDSDVEGIIAEVMTGVKLIMGMDE